MKIGKNNKKLHLVIINVMLVLLMMTTVAKADEVVTTPQKPVAAKSASKKEPSFLDRLKAKAIVYKEKAIVYKEKAEQVVKEYVERFFGDDNTRMPASTPKPEIPAVVKEKLEELPSYKTEGVEQQTAEIKAVKDQIAKKEVYQKKPGRAADASLPKAKSGVAVFDLYEKPDPKAPVKIGKNGKKIKPKPKMVKTIPVLDIGVEDEVVKSDFTFELPKIFQADFLTLKPLKSPSVKPESELTPFYTMKFAKAQKPVKLEEVVLALPRGITADKIHQTAIKIEQDTPISLKPYVEITAKEIQLLKGLLFSEYADRCHLAAGYFRELRDLTGEEKNLRDYNYSTCLYKMGFHTEAFPMLSDFVKRNSKETKAAVETLLSDVKREYVPQISDALIQVKSEHIPEKKVDEFNYYIALGRSMKKQHKTALSYALKVKPASEKYPEAQYLASVAEYLTGDVKSSLARQERLLVEIDKRKVTGPLKTLIKMNMGRTAYRNKQYKKAIEAYQFVGRENSLWIQSLTEQGWMQILAGDTPGAIGNMHSIQIPQFKDIYKAESYAVRAIGYINICQFGDAKKTLDHLNKIYSPWVRVIGEELSKKQPNYALYNNVIDAIRTPENKTSLPQPVLREISRHKDFLNVQESINHKVDEEAQFGFIRGLIRKDLSTATSRRNAANARSKKLAQQIKSASSANDTLKFVTQWRAEKSHEDDTIDYYKFEIETIKESLKGFNSFTRYAKGNIEKEKSSLKSLAGRTMKSRLASMQTRLKKLMENNEFLTYEIFSGSGENIRYVSAGGEVKGTKSTRKTASKNHERGKVFLWDFDGEFWADEIGNYRSSLKDNCPNAKNLTQQVK